MSGCDVESFKVYGPYFDPKYKSPRQSDNSEKCRRDIANFMMLDMAGQLPNGKPWRVYSFGELAGTFEKPVHVGLETWHSIRGLVFAHNGDTDVEDVIQRYSANNRISEELYDWNKLPFSERRQQAYQESFIREVLGYSTLDGQQEQDDRRAEINNNALRRVRVRPNFSNHLYEQMARHAFGEINIVENQHLNDGLAYLMAGNNLVRIMNIGEQDESQEAESDEDSQAGNPSGEGA